MKNSTAFEREKPLEVADDPRLSSGVKAFLNVLNSSGGPPLETLPPLEAREVLANAQASVSVDLSGIEESEKTITADGYKIRLNIVRPEGVKGKLPVFIFIHGGGWVLGDYLTHKRMVRPTNVQFMVKDSTKYAATGGWGFGHFKDGNPGDDAFMKTCFPCHAQATSTDLVFTHYAP